MAGGLSAITTMASHRLAYHALRQGLPLALRVEQLHNRELPLAVAGAMEASDHPLALLVASEAARRFEAVACAERNAAGELERIAMEMEGYRGVPGPMLALSVHAVQVLDLDGRILHASPKAAELTGLPENVMRGRKPTDFLALTPFLARFEEDCAAAAKGETRRAAGWWTDPLGKPHFISYLLKPVRCEARPVALVLLSADLTGQPPSFEEPIRDGEPTFRPSASLAHICGRCWHPRAAHGDDGACPG